MAELAPENPNATKVPMIEITTSNSMRVKPFLRGIFRASGRIRGYSFFSCKPQYLAHAIQTSKISDFKRYYGPHFENLNKSFQPQKKLGLGF
jgi:hypothetical protein